MAEVENDRFTSITVPRYFEGKSVFLTGGTGFIGKVVLEKLLRGCPGLKNIYFLVRPKKGLSCTERMDKVFNIPLFSKLNEINPDAKNKVIPIPGDVVHNSIGISDGDRQLLRNSVNIVIHSAATIRFDEPIRVAMNMNVLAVQEMVKLAGEMKCLEVFCHISTAYSQCNNADEIEERFYPASVNYQKLIDAMEWMSDDMLQSFTKPLIGEYPNTYCFTKALAEAMLKEEATHLPLLIIRPSIVCSSISDPIPGWIDNYNGISGVIAAVGKGVLRTIHGSNVKNDIVPVDLVSNCIISGVWYYGVTRPSQPVICNCTSGNVNPTTFLSLERSVLPTLLSFPYNSIFRRPNFSFACNRFVNRYWKVISHYIPAIIIDGLSILVGSKPRIMNLYRSIDNSLDVFSFFIHNEWKWNNVQYSRILKTLPDEDREMFDFDMRKIEWTKYYESLTIGIKIYLIKDDMKELPKAIQLQRRYKMVRWISSLLITLVACRFFFLKSERVRRLWFEALFAMYRFLQFFNITNISA